MAITLGSSPEALTVVLSRDLPFRAVIQGRTAAGTEFTWPDGTSCVLILGDLHLTAAQDGATFTFTATADQVNTLLDERLTAATLCVIDNDGTRLPWARGKVVER